MAHFKMSYCEFFKFTFDLHMIYTVGCIISMFKTAFRIIKLFCISALLEVIRVWDIIGYDIIFNKYYICNKIAYS